MPPPLQMESSERGPLFVGPSLMDGEILLRPKCGRFGVRCVGFPRVFVGFAWFLVGFPRVFVGFAWFLVGSQGFCGFCLVFGGFP